MILFLYGPDTFRSRQNLKESVAQFKKTRDPQGINVVFLDGKKESAGRIISELSAAPFLAERRMVIIENLLSSSDKESLNTIITAIKDKKIPESNIAVFWQGDKLSKVKEATTLQELLVEEKYAQEFRSFVGGEVLNWVKKEIEKRGGKISAVAVNFLSQNSGADTWLLNSLIDQLIAYTGPREISLTDVELFLGEKLNDNIYDMVGAMFSGDRRMGLKLLYEQRRLGEDDHKIFGLILWQMRLVLEIADLLEREGDQSSDEIARKLGIKPFPARKSKALARQYPLSILQRRFAELSEIDYKTKNGLAPQPLMIDLFVVRK